MLIDTKIQFNNYNKNNKKTIIVMVCSIGQSILLINFICAAKARNLDIGNLLIFATDLEMYNLVQELFNNQVAVYYDFRVSKKMF